MWRSSPPDRNVVRLIGELLVFATVIITGIDGDPTEKVSVKLDTEILNELDGSDD
jgi:hypothetical protein